MAADSGTDIPVGVAMTGAAARPRAVRDVWLRTTVYCMAVGAVLTAINAWVLAGQTDVTGGVAGIESYLHIAVPLLALAAVFGALLMERAPMAGVALTLAATAACLPGGGRWLAPGALCGCIWGVRHSRGVQVMLGLFLLIPGIAGVYYGVLSALEYRTGIQLVGVPGILNPPLTLRQAMAPIELLPLALAGAWLLVQRSRGEAAQGTTPPS